MNFESELGGMNNAQEGEDGLQSGDRSGFARLLKVAGLTASLAMAALGCSRKGNLPDVHSSKVNVEADNGFGTIEGDTHAANDLLAALGNQVTFTHSYAKMEIEREKCDIVNSETYKGEARFVLYMGVDCPEQNKFYDVYDICYKPKYTEEDRGYSVSCIGDHIVRRHEGIRMGNFRTFPNQK